jgi:hypothetical protein
MTADDMMFVLRNGTREINIDAYGEENLKQLAVERERYGSIAGFVNNECVGVGGIEPQWNGVGEAWLMLSNRVALYPVKAYLVIRDGLQKLIEENELVRIQSWVRADFHKAHVLMKHLGFKPEGLAKKYNPDGTDSILYSIVREKGPNGNER